MNPLVSAPKCSDLDLESPDRSSGLQAHIGRLHTVHTPFARLRLLGPGARPRRVERGERGPVGQPVGENRWEPFPRLALCLVAC